MGSDTSLRRTQPRRRRAFRGLLHTPTHPELTAEEVRDIVRHYPLACFWWRLYDLPLHTGGLIADNMIRSTDGVFDANLRQMVYGIRTVSELMGSDDGTYDVW